MHVHQPRLDISRNFIAISCTLFQGLMKYSQPFSRNRSSTFSLSLIDLTSWRNSKWSPSSKASPMPISISFRLSMNSFFSSSQSYASSYAYLALSKLSFPNPMFRSSSSRPPPPLPDLYLCTIWKSLLLGYFRPLDFISFFVMLPKLSCWLVLPVSPIYVSNFI